MDAPENEYESLTNKQKLFILAYVGEARFNATQAARIAGYSGDESTLGVAGFRLLRNAKISGCIRQFLEERTATAEECLARITRRARGSAANLFANEFGSRVFSMEAAFDTGEIHNIKKVKQGKDGLEVELYDAQQADALLLRVYEKLVAPDGEGESEEEPEKRNSDPEQKKIEVVYVDDNTSTAAPEPAED